MVDFKRNSMWIVFTANSPSFYNWEKTAPCASSRTLLYYSYLPLQRSQNAQRNATVHLPGKPHQGYSYAFRRYSSCGITAKKNLPTVTNKLFMMKSCRNKTVHRLPIVWKHHRAMHIAVFESEFFVIWASPLRKKISNGLRLSQSAVGWFLSRRL